MASVIPVPDIPILYAEGRGRVTVLVAGLDADGAAAPVPACPGWSVHDVVAHLSGVCADILAGNIAGVATDPWTAAQVDARRGRPLADVVAEWSELAPQVEAFAGNFPGRTGEQWVTDLTTHEHDIRGALGRPGERDSEAVAIGLDFLVGELLAPSLAARGLGPLLVRVDGRSWVAGEEREPVGELEAPAFDLFRALTGRRSRAQVSGFGWSVDPEPYLDAFTSGPFTVAPADLVE